MTYVPAAWKDARNNNGANDVYESSDRESIPGVSRKSYNVCATYAYAICCVSDKEVYQPGSNNRTNRD